MGGDHRPGAVRNTRDIDLLIRRADLPAVTAALEAAGFVRGEVLDVLMFRDGEEGMPSEAVHILFVGEKTRPNHALPAPRSTPSATPRTSRSSRWSPCW